MSAFLAFFVIGLGAGAVHFACLHANVLLYGHGGSWRKATALLVTRLCVTVVTAALSAAQGPICVLAWLVGFMVARSLAFHRPAFL